MNSWNRDLFIKAWDFATRYHAGQTYGGPIDGMRIDYLNHIGSVAMEVIWALQHSSEILNQDLAIQCAILHDTIEDTTATFETVELHFGTDIAQGVLALTKDTKLDNKQIQMADSLARIKKQPKEIWLVKMADRITNLYHPPYYWNNDKIKSYIQEAEIIYTELKDGNDILAKRLKEKIKDYHKFLK